MSGIITRRATKADIAAIVRLQHQMMDYHEALDARFRHRDDIEAVFSDYLLSLLIDEKAAVFVAMVDGQVAGYTMGHDRTAGLLIPERHGFVSDICVDSACRTKGVGSALVASLKAWFRARGLSNAWAHVATENPVSQSFWRKQGGKDFQDILHFDLAE